MDVISIILAIGGVIAGLFILWAVLMLIVGAVARRAVFKFSKKADAENEQWRKRHGFR